jgi:carboxyl-terminal processing protease
LIRPALTARRWLALALALGALASPVTARTEEPPPAPSPLSAEQKARNVEAFDVVWTTIRDTHYDAGLGGVDWPAVRDEFRPKVEAAPTMDQARSAIRGAIGRLGLSHFGIIPAEAYQALNNPAGGPGDLGLDLRVIDGRAVVTSVLDGSPAATAGVGRGWVIEKVGDRTTASIFEAAEAAYKDNPMKPVYKARGVLGRLEGPVGQSVAVEFLDADDRPARREMAFAEPQGVAADFGNLPRFHVRFESKRVDRSVAYVGLNIFFDVARVMAGFSEAVASARDAEGMIVDLRGNPGGVGAMAIGLGGWFVTEPDRKLGTMITRSGSMHFALNPRSSPYEGPVAVLVDELSMSTSEILAGGLQDLKRARVFGVKTPGAALPSRIDVLPNGDRFQHAFANYVSAGGKPLEGVGVTPDVAAPPTRPAQLDGHDPAIEAAVAWIRSTRAH